MSLNEDLASWTGSRPGWQRAAVARFCRNETLSDADVARTADQLVAGTETDVPAVTAEQFPGATSPGETVKLLRLSGVSGVNALLAGQELTLGPVGLTIIFGDNASGKSGYARLIRKAVTARVKSDLLGDVFSDTQTAQTAQIDFASGDREDSWRLGEAQSLALSRVRFFDEECGHAYVTTASEVNYRPSALTILDRLTDACVEVQAELERRLAANRSGRPELPSLHTGTPASVFLGSLSDRTTQAEIDAATAFSEDQRQELGRLLAEQARLQGSDSANEKRRLASLAVAWRTVASHVEQIATQLDDDALKGLQEMVTRAADLRTAERIASSATFEGEPLGGVGSATWRTLWEAALQYSQSEAYHGHDYPVTGDGARCVLCQQPLADEASHRLTRFQAFVSDTTARDADRASKAVETRRDTLLALESIPAAVSSALAQLQLSGEAVDRAEKWVATAAETAVQVLSWLAGSSEACPPPVVDDVSGGGDSRARELSERAALLDSTSFQGVLNEITASVHALQDQLSLSEAKGAIGAEVARLIERSKIEEAKRATDTTGITRKKRELSETYVTEQVRDHFTRETEVLHLRRVTLTPTPGRREAAAEHRPTLLGSARTVPIDQVLSEGEQTALGLAGFLTEVEFDHSKSGVVLDDPVSSLDAGRRSRVARRLVELARTRQVIVFTHEASFVTALDKSARDAGVDVTCRSILRQGDEPGKTSDDHPWTTKDTRARIGSLRAELARLKSERGSLDSEQYTKRVREWAGELSETWERAVNIEVINEVVDRATSEVRPRMFRVLAAITEEDDRDFQNGYAKASEWAPRHDNAPDTNWIAPEPDELEPELGRLVAWFDRIRSYRSA